MFRRSVSPEITRRVSVPASVLLAVVLGFAWVAVLTVGPAVGVDQAVTGGDTVDGENTTTFGTTVYTGSEDGKLVAVAVDGGTSEQMWESDVGGTVGVPDDGLLYQSAPTAADGTVYVTSQTEAGSGTTGNLTALDAETGTVEWRFSDAGFIPDGSPTIVDGVVYVTSVFGDVHAIDADTGDLVWQTTVPTNSSEDATLKSAPTVVNGTVYVTGFGNNEFNLYALDVGTGEQRWTYTTPDSFSGTGGSPTYYQGTVYLTDRLHAAGETAIRAVDATTGEEEWTFDKSLQIWGTPVVANGTLYLPTGGVGQPSAGVYALDADTGDKEWFFDNISDGSFMKDSATVVDETVYFGTRGNNESGFGGERNESTVYAVDARTGAVEWTFDELSNRVASTPTVHDGTVYVGTGKNNKYDPNGVGHLYGLDAETGAKEFAYNRSDNGTGLVGSPTVVERANGSSVGSRVLQGILGHTDDFPIQTGAELTLTDPTGDAVDGTVTIVDGSGTVIGGQGGQYTLLLDPGTHTIEITAPDFETQQLTVEVSEGELIERAVALAHAHDVGDVDHDGGLSVVDAVLVQRHLAEMNPAPFDSTLADVDRDGEVSIVDAVLVQQRLAELRDPGRVVISDTNVSTAGGTTTVTVTVENTGGLGALQTVEHRVADTESGLDVTATRAVDGVDLRQADRQSLTFQLDTGSLDPGTYHYEVVTDDDSETLQITESRQLSGIRMSSVRG